MKKAKKIFKGLTKGHTSILLKFYNFFALCGPFGPKNSGDWRNLTPKAIKAKKADIRPNLSKVDVWIFRTLTMVSQHSKGSYKVPWRPIGTPFWEMTTSEPKKGPSGQKTSPDKKLLKFKVKGNYLMVFFDF